MHARTHARKHGEAEYMNHPSRSSQLREPIQSNSVQSTNQSINQSTNQSILHILQTWTSAPAHPSTLATSSRTVSTPTATTPASARPATLSSGASVPVSARSLFSLDLLESLVPSERDCPHQLALCRHKTLLSCTRFKSRASSYTIACL